MENGLFDIHEFINYEYKWKRDLTYERETKQIDAVLSTLGVATAIKGSELIDFHKIIKTDYRSYLFNIDLEQYFSEIITLIDKIDYRKLDSSRMLDRNKFIEKVRYFILI